MRLNKREVGNVLAALRFWQEQLDAHSSVDREQRKHAKALEPLHLNVSRPMSANEIDALCEKINTEW